MPHQRYLLLSEVFPLPELRGWIQPNLREKKLSRALDEVRWKERGRGREGRGKQKRKKKRWKREKEDEEEGGGRYVLFRAAE
jgi:hypothetical protein